jgi:hypothetical protein
MAVSDIVQVGVTTDPWAFTSPSLTFEGVWMENGNSKHIWEACSPDCVSCPTGTITPCNDPTLINTTMYGGSYTNGTTYNVGQFVEGPNGNCYQALNNGTLPSPTGLTNSSDWDYIGCVSWICPQDLGNVPSTVCEMISGDSTTINGVLVGGNTFYQSCVDTFNNGNCYMDRWLCQGQYSCNGCISVDSTHPQYNDPGFPNSVVFDNEIDCLQWCEPIAWSCTTPTSTGGGCCDLLSCNEDVTEYINTVGYYAGTLNLPATTLALSPYDLYLSPLYDVTDCNDDCCDLSGYIWNCEGGCVLVAGITTSLTDCIISSPDGLGLPGTVPCGYTCDDIFTPYAPTAVPPTSPCGPCYTIGCSVYLDEPTCVTNCFQTMGCWECDCTDITVCSYTAACPTLIVGSTTVYGPNPTLGTYDQQVDCDNNCDCDAGWDCYIDLNTNTSQEFCSEQQSQSTMSTLSLGFSVNGPYTSFSACCEDTGCCHVDCDEPLATSQGLTPPMTGTWPCVWSQTYSTTAQCSPLGPLVGLPFCTMTECFGSLDPNGGCAGDNDCLCACTPIVGNVLLLNPTGLWDSMNQMYTQYDTVSWGDANTPTCCFICMCPNTGGISLDCSNFTPGDGPASNGTPNCWVSCGATPGISPNGCDPCTGGPGQTYECSSDGCLPSACIHDPSFTQTSQNCYTTSTCDMECQAGCYCDDLNDSDPTNDISTCVMLQNVLNGISQPSTTTLYPMVSINQCQLSLAASPPLNCCAPPGQVRYICDSGDNCNDGSTQLGLGCLQVMPGDPNYVIAPFTQATATSNGFSNALLECQSYCTWECDPSGLHTCLFTPNSTFSPTHNSAYDCYQNTNQCDCSVGQQSWYCHSKMNNATAINSCVTGAYAATLSTTDQQIVYGPGQVSYFAGSVGFVTVGDCEAYCRFCCDPLTSCVCELDWGNNNCNLTIAQCNVLQYPCCSVEYYCDDMDGCSSYPFGSPPAIFASGPYTTLQLCQDQCNFVCGDCVNDCLCQFVNTPVGVGCNPFNAMIDCQNAQGGVVGGIGCCDCYNCIQNGSVTYQVWDAGLSTWVYQSTTVTATPTNITIWSNMVVYSPGDVVTFTDPGGNTCCYVNVYTIPPGIPTTPYEFWSGYLNDVANNNPVGLGSGSGNLVWVPCDTNCPTPANIITWDCIPGTITNSCDGNIFLVDTTYPTISWAGSFIPNYTEHVMFVADAANGLQSTPWSQIKSEHNNTATSCPTPLGGIWLGIELAIVGCMGVPALDTILTSAPIYTTSYTDFVNQITALGIPGVTLSNTHMQNNLAYGIYCEQANTESGYSNETPGGYEYVNIHTCNCTSAPCTCVQVNGSSGQYPLQSNCLIAANATPCCVPPSTGYWVCDMSTPCGCIWDPNAVVGYNTQNDCTSDTSTCCFIQPPMLWECVTSNVAPGNLPSNTRSQQQPEQTTQSSTWSDVNVNGLAYIGRLHNNIWGNCTVASSWAGCAFIGPNNFLPGWVFDGIVPQVGMFLTITFANSPTQCMEILKVIDQSEFASGTGTMSCPTDFSTPQPGSITYSPCPCNVPYSVLAIGHYSSVVASTQIFWDCQGCLTNTSTICNCQQTPTGTHLTLLDCQNDITNCCTGTTESFDCEQQSSICYDPGNGLGAYSTLAQCQANCRPTQGNCGDCGDELSPQYFPNSTLPITYIPLPTAGAPPIQLWLGDCISDIHVGGSGTECCWCCVCPHGYQINPVNGNTECLGAQTITRLSGNESITPSHCEVEVIINAFNYPVTNMFGSTFYDTDMVSCGLQSDGTPCGPGGSGPGSSGPTGSGPTGSGPTGSGPTRNGPIMN